MGDREDLLALRRLAELEARAGTPATAPAEQPESSTLKNVVGGAIRGAGSIGATLLWPYDKAMDAISGQGPQTRNEIRRETMNQGLREFGVDTDSTGFSLGKLGGEIAGTAGIGGVFGGAAKLLGASPKAVTALSTSGLKTGAPGNLIGRELAKDVALRTAAGGAVGGASAGLVNPSDAGSGSMIGAALPGVVKASGAVGSAVGGALKGEVSDAVAALAKRAKELGIDIPADRIANSKPLNAVAAGLNYVPFSGRQATEEKMADQLNKALSKTFGQDSSNVTQALRTAQTDLGGKFDKVLRGNTVKVDDKLLAEMGDIEQVASRELSSDGMSIIKKQIDEIMAKGEAGQIDGQAAYNIKRTLDRIGQRNSPEAFQARELKKALMGALDRSLGPEEAKAFATVRKQYGNMLELEGIAQNGAEGGISIARLANMKGIGNKDLQELADIAAQFVKPREGAHGAAQRAFAGMGLSMLGSSVGGPLGAAVGLGASAATGRLANAAMNSQAAKNMLLNPEDINLLGKYLVPAARTAPLLSTSE